MNQNNTVNIKIKDIYPHPDNPRKDLGDLSELADSIKKKGIMQNLTVIKGHFITGDEWSEMAKEYKEKPTEELRNKMNTIHTGEWLETGYTLLIGHRRCAAAKQAGIEELPCKVVTDVSKKEQVAIMLEENMQRNDLTIWEQANGFQMMIDLGESEEQIAEKTGFSKTTVHHRLNIAKLNQKELKKKEQDEDFQLSLKDLYELEKVKDIQTRNKILREAYNSKNLAIRAKNEAEEEKRDEREKTIRKMLEEKGVKEAPKEVKENYWNASKWDTIQRFNLDEKPPKSIRLKKTEEQKFYIRSYGWLYVITKIGKGKKELSPYEKQEQELKAKKKKIKNILAESTARRKRLIEDIIAGKADKVKDETGEINLIWQAMLQMDTCIFKGRLIRFFIEKDEYKATDEEKKAAQEKIDKIGTLSHQMLIFMHTEMTQITELINYKSEFNQERGEALLQGYKALEPYGWYFATEEEKSILDGTNEMYKKEEAAE